jgi:hypothetical protein
VCCFIKIESAAPDLDETPWFRLWETAEYFEVHRSMRLDDTSRMYRKAMELVESLEPVFIERLRDRSMIGHAVDVIKYFHKIQLSSTDERTQSISPGV